MNDEDLSAEKKFKKDLYWFIDRVLNRIDILNLTREKCLEKHILNLLIYAKPCILNRINILNLTRSKLRAIKD